MANAKRRVDEICELTISIGERLKASSRKKMNAYDFTISRVPAAIRRGKEVYYEPTIISIGPYHRGKQKYEAMEEHKWGQLQDFLDRNPNISINTYLTELSKLETDARRCYFENVKLSSKELLEMLLLDGCFILELFLKLWEPNSRRPKAPIIYTSNIYYQVIIDLLLLENQIPFFVLECLFDLLMGVENNYNWLLELVAACFYVFYKITGRDDDLEYYANECLYCDEVYDHLLHFFHCFHLPIIKPEIIQPNYKSLSTLVEIVPKWLKPLELVSLCFCSLRRRKVEQRKNRTTVPCATKLLEVGITFKKKSLTSFLVETFNDGTLEVPCFFIDDFRRSLLMNLIAFEQCNLPSDKRTISFYASFMDNIIDTTKDVEILQKSNILESYLNSDEETANFFNRLSDHVIVIFEESYLVPVIEKINKYCETSRHKWRAKLMRDYFSNPWAILSLVAAVILLILTFLQTFFAMYSYFKLSN